MDGIALVLGYALGGIMAAIALLAVFLTVDFIVFMVRNRREGR